MDNVRQICLKLQDAKHLNVGKCPSCIELRDCSLKYVQLMLILISNISKEVFKRIFVSNAIKYAEKHEIVIS